jgi:hypothetical protein
MRAVWFIEKLELVLNCNNYENLNPKSRTSQTRKTLSATLDSDSAERLLQKKRNGK